MAVESRFVVIRHGVEAKTFMDKKSADEYDKMLDMADNLAEVFNESPIELSDTASEELSIYLAQHREEVLVALLAKKATKKITPAPDKPKNEVPLEQVATTATDVKKAKTPKVSKAAKTAKAASSKAVKLSAAS